MNQRMGKEAPTQQEEEAIRLYEAVAIRCDLQEILGPLGIPMEVFKKMYVMEFYNNHFALMAQLAISPLYILKGINPVYIDISTPSGRILHALNYCMVRGQVAFQSFEDYIAKIGVHEEAHYIEMVNGVRQFTPHSQLFLMNEFSINPVWVYAHSAKSPMFL